MNSTAKLKIALFGCGNFSRRYHVPTLDAEARARLSVICDTGSAPALRELAARSGATLTARIEDLFVPGACDAVIISTPHTLHAAHAMQCLAHGKHVLVERMRTKMAAATIAPLAVYLCSDSGREVNGQVFHVRANEVLLYSHMRPLRSVHRGEGWTPQTLAEHGIPALKGSFTPVQQSADIYTWEPI